MGRITNTPEGAAHCGSPRFDRVFFMVTIFLISSSLSAQDFQTTLFGNMGMGYQQDDKNVYDPGFSGAGIRFDRIQNIDSSRISLINGFEYSFLGWGSQVLMNNGFGFQFFQKGKFTAGGKFLALNGIALFRPKLLYTGAFELGADVSFALKQNFSINLNFGFRYSVCPKYQDYGPIWSYSDIPIGLGLLWKLY